MTVRNKQEEDTLHQARPVEPAADSETHPGPHRESTPSTESTPPPGANETAPDWQDRYLRLAAEFDNFRKRTAREFGDLIRGAERDLIAELTEVLDNLGRAVEADHKGESVEEFAKGVALIRDQLTKVLKDRGLERMESVGQPFDPGAHDALMRMPSDQHHEGIVMQEVTPGYRLGDKVLRHAKVIVSQGAPQSGEEAEGHKKDT